MISTSTSASTSTKEILHVAIEIANEGQLCKLNSNISLKEIIQDLCFTYKIPYQEGQYALTLKYVDANDYRYINESNRHEIVDGSELKLVYSPLKMAKILEEKLILIVEDNDDANWTLGKLQELCLDYIFAEQFLLTGSMKIVLDLIQDVKLVPHLLSNCLRIVASMMKHMYITSLEDSVTRRVVQLVLDVSSQDIVCLPSLAILASSVTYTGDEYVNNTVKMTDLLRHLCNQHNVEIQQYALALMNAMARSKNKKILAAMASKTTKEMVGQQVLGTDCKPNLGIASELFAYQTLIFSLKEKKLNTNIDQCGLDAASIAELNNIEVTEKVTRHSVGSLLDDDKTYNLSQSKATSLQNFTVHFPLPAKERQGPREAFLRSKSNVDGRRGSDENESSLEPRSVTLDFTRSDFTAPISRLTLECMLYFARAYPKQYVRMLLAEEASWQPFPMTCQRITKLVCEVLGVKKTKSSVKKFQPLLFKEGSYLEEIFCRMLLQLGKTRRDMKARTQADQEKVIWVLKRQLKETLVKQPTSLKNVNTELRNFNYATISEMWQKEQKDKEDWKINNSPSILELKESYKEETVALIRQQRINVLRNGMEFSKTNFRHQKKNRTSYIYLTPNQKGFHYYDQEEGRMVPETSGNINLSDISSLVTGKKCPHIKDIKNNKPEYDLAFSMILKSDRGSYDCVAPDQLTFDHWIDGINTLIGKEMKSKTMEDDLEKLVEMEVRLQLLDIQGTEIPSEPPHIPAEPPNYDFCYVAMRKSHQGTV